MPYGSNYRRPFYRRSYRATGAYIPFRRTRFNRKNGPSNGPGKASYNKAMQAKFIRDLLRVESKFVDGLYTDDIPVTLSAIAKIQSTNAGTEPSSNLNEIAIGSGFGQREGRKILVTSLFFRGEFTTRTRIDDAAPEGACVRLMVVLDRQCNGAIALSTDIVQRIGASTSDYYHFNNLSNKRRFRVLYDKTFAMNYSAAAGTDETANLVVGESQQFEIFLKNLNIPIEFDDSANDGGIDTVRSNNLLLRCCSNLPDEVTITFSARTRYTDV